MGSEHPVSIVSLGRSPFAALATSAPTATSSSSTINWVNMTGGTSPSPRELPSVAYDPADKYTVLFGGGIHPSALSYSDTWKYDGGVWTQLTPGVSPIGRLGAGMVYDGKDGYVLLFGGYNETSASFLNDTWKFSNGQWTRLLPASAPSPRWLFGLDYDATLGKVVLYGGGNFGGLADTWTYANGVWSQLTFAGNSPPALSDTSMAYDPAFGHTVLFGGDGFSGATSATWTLAGGRWTNVTSSVRPPAGADYGLVFDSELGTIVLATDIVPATWTLTNSTWTNISSQISTAYPGRSHFGIADDPKDGYVLVCEGAGSGPGGWRSDTWAIDGFRATAPAISPATGEVGIPVSFGTTATGGIGTTTYSWTFGDGLSGTGATSTHAFATAGSFTVMVSIADAHRATATRSFPFQVVPRLTVTASANQSSVDVGMSLSLMAHASGGVPPITINWSLPGGGSANGTSLQLIYGTVGSTNVSVTATDAEGVTATASILRTVGSLPTCSIHWSPYFPTSAGSVSFQANVVGGTPGFTYAWNFGDGSNATGPAPSHAFANVGAYRVTLTVTDAAGAAASTVSSIVVTSHAPFVAFGLNLLAFALVGVLIAVAVAVAVIVLVTRQRHRDPPMPPT
ncbi:MAG TPA: PKD domain-containing protein [Thermoplasmata archaeon]|nr:PKD domain-containing protein [Thermoplasmata archaeon]